MATGAEKSDKEETRSAFLEWIDKDPEKADAAIEELRRGLVMMFCARGRADAAEDLAHAAIIRAIEKCTEKNRSNFRNPFSFAYGVAKKVLLEDLRRVRSEPKGETDKEPAVIARYKIDGESPDEIWNKLAESCLDELPKKQRSFIVHYTETQRAGEPKTVAERNKAFLIRKKLQWCVERRKKALTSRRSRQI